ncbi:MAG: serine hydrolase domain-containing protein [Gemmatimonadaceae bacterium]
MCRPQLSSRVRRHAAHISSSLQAIEDGRPITPRTTFDLGSVSKQFTGLAVLMLEQQGKLSSGDDVRRWISELPDYGNPIRVRDLLEHTSGLRDYQALEALAGRPVRTMSEFLGLMAAQRTLNFAPGTRHEYSHSDYMLLGIVVERVVGEPFGDFLERAVLGPLGMRDAFVSDERVQYGRNRALGHVGSPAGAHAQFPNSRTFGGVNLYVSVEDLAHWDRNFDEPQIGGRSVVARMTSLPVLANGDTIPYAYGLRLGSYRGLRTIERAGSPGGNHTYMIRFPERRFGVAALCNANYLDAGTLAKKVADLYLLDALQPPRQRAPAPAAVSISSDELARYAGVYSPPAAPWNLLPVEVRNGALGELVFDDVRDDTVYVMTPAGNGRFFEIGLSGNVGLYTFRPPAAGTRWRLEISWNGGPVETLDRIPDSALWRPSAAALAEYEGIWFSQELDASWRLDARNGRLFLRRIGKPDAAVWPVNPDLFIRGFGSIEILTAQMQFHRDGAGKLTHLTVSTPPGEESVRDVRFVRVSPR